MHGDVSKILLKPGAPEPKVLLPHDVMGGTPGADARACQATHFVKPLTLSSHSLCQATHFVKPLTLSSHSLLLPAGARRAQVGARDPAVQQGSPRDPRQGEHFFAPRTEWARRVPHPVRIGHLVALLEVSFSAARLSSSACPAVSDRCHETYPSRR